MVEASLVIMWGGRNGKVSAFPSLILGQQQTGRTHLRGAPKRQDACALIGRAAGLCAKYGAAYLCRGSRWNYHCRLQKQLRMGTYGKVFRDLISVPRNTSLCKAGQFDLARRRGEHGRHKTGRKATCQSGCPPAFAVSVSGHRMQRVPSLGPSAEIDFLSKEVRNGFSDGGGRPGQPHGHRQDQLTIATGVINRDGARGCFWS